MENANSLKRLRIQKGLTQADCARIVGMPLRTYVRYETEDSRKDSMKYRFALDLLSEYGKIDEAHGILSIDDIIDKTKPIFDAYEVEQAYLFGSYAKGIASETSDVDILVFMPINGLKFYELIEALRENLGKRIDLLDDTQLDDNAELAKEILKGGLKIYG